MAEINPRHPATKEMHDVWHKMVAILMHKQGLKHVVLTAQDIQKTLDGGVSAVVFQERPDGIHLDLVNGDGVASLIAHAKAEEVNFDDSTSGEERGENNS